VCIFDLVHDADPNVSFYQITQTERGSTMRRLRTFILAIVMTSLVTVETSAQIQNVLLEQHTGAWCGWCPDGTVKMDEILDLYGDQVIGVKIHGGDAMEIPEHKVIADALGLSGFPTGSVNRSNSGGSVFLSRYAWKSACESQMQQTARAEVDCFYTLDRMSRTVRIQVVANITESMDFPLKFNAFIVEDDVTGTGSGYDQSNYLSGRNGFEDNPYYGYHHMKVVRKMIGGPWGAANGLPESVKAGDFYAHEFVSNIDSRWNIDNLHFIGVLQADDGDNKEIINSAMAIENGSLLNRIINSDTPTSKALAPVSDFNNVYTLENVTNEEQTYTVTLLTTEKTPADWSAQFACGSTELATSDTHPAIGQIVVPANSSAEFSLTLKVGSTLGVGDAKIILELDGIPAATRTRTLSGITSEIKKVLLETGSNFSLEPLIDMSLHDDIITLDPSDYIAFADELNNVKLVIWNKGRSDELSPEEIDIIKNSRNVNNFICGDVIVWSLAYPDNLSYFGLEYIGWNLEAQGSTGTVWLSGQQGDVITGGLGENIEGRLFQYYIDMVRIADTENVFPIMHFQNDGIRQKGNNTYSIMAEDAIFGVRSTKNNSRTVLLGISPYALINERTRRSLIANILDWLVENIREVDPAVDEGFETGDFSTFDWSNHGDSPWVVTSNEFYSGSYSAQAGSIGNGETASLRVTLDCVDGDISFFCKVSSESSCDCLEFYINGWEEGEWSGERGWTYQSFPVLAGRNTFEWRYSKDDSYESGRDTCWIDEIVFPLQ